MVDCGRPWCTWLGVSCLVGEAAGTSSRSRQRYIAAYAAAALETPKFDLTQIVFDKPMSTTQALVATAA